MRKEAIITLIVLFLLVGEEVKEVIQEIKTCENTSNQ